MNFENESKMDSMAKSIDLNAKILNEMVSKMNTIENENNYP
jgi:hypothetical protein